MTTEVIPQKTEELKEGFSYASRPKPLQARYKNTVPYLKYRLSSCGNLRKSHFGTFCSQEPKFVSIIFINEIIIINYAKMSLNKLLIIELNLNIWNKYKEK